MVWRFISGFNDGYMMTEDGHIQNMDGGALLEHIPITIHGEMGVLMKNSDQFWRLIPVHDLLCLTFPDRHQKAVEYAVMCANCKEPIGQSIENGRWYHAKNRIACIGRITHAKPGESWEL